MESQPVVSVLALSMNHAPYVEQACKSIINQTFRNIEVLYLDNASLDNTFEIADQLFRSSGLIYTGIRQTESRSISANFNSLLGKARGKFIAILSLDDWWTIDNLETKVKCFTQDPAYGLVYGNGYIYLEKTQTTRLFYEQIQKSGWVFRDLLKGNFMHAASVVLKLDAIKEVGVFDERSLIEDWEMWLRISEKFQVGYTDKPMTYYRVSTNNLSGNLAFMNRGFEYIFDKYRSYPEMKKARKSIQMGQAYNLAEGNPGWKSLVYILKHFQWNLNYVKQVVRCIFGMVGYKFK